MTIIKLTGFANKDVAEAFRQHLKPDEAAQAGIVITVVDLAESPELDSDGFCQHGLAAGVGCSQCERTLGERQVQKCLARLEALEHQLEELTEKYNTEYDDGEVIHGHFKAMRHYMATLRQELEAM